MATNRMDYRPNGKNKSIPADMKLITKKLIGMNKTIYIAPEVEQIKVRFEENIMSAAKTNAPKMSTESADAWGEWE